MNLHQLRFVHEAVRQDYNLTRVSKAMLISQPGVSKAILDLEQELGVEIFTRHGKRLSGLTRPGQDVVRAISQILEEIGELKRVARQFATQLSGALTIAATQSLMRGTLPGVVKALTDRHPGVRLTFQQGSPAQVAEMVRKGNADVGILPDAVDTGDRLASLPFCPTEAVALLPAGHPLLGGGALTLASLARHPLLTYDTSFAMRKRLEDAFAAHGLQADIRIESADAEVIQHCVAQRMGVGIVERPACDNVAWGGRTGELHAMPLGHLFDAQSLCIVCRRGVSIAEPLYTFLELLSPGLTRAAIERVLEVPAEPVRGGGLGLASPPAPFPRTGEGRKSSPLADRLPSPARGRGAGGEGSPSSPSIPTRLPLHHEQAIA
ncbi:LysR family cys regulon transcriptional activator [Cupriavidus gilardii J11]|uniref:LysR family cys regulon transcriptional activator n=1 Tax=Cupriavidus gilardii J11 TaxID=936133 RepID=A0A562BTA3_9BURK|nr:LysR substrate-binding domain-containing protein [Cupriavidus gilardii]TWG88476.1 LysR family cys regulon transcriptional activator [Cupriavidus gilardii J11]